MKLHWLALLSLPLVTLSAGCADLEDDEVLEDTGDAPVDETVSTADALTGVVPDGSIARTTSNLRLRSAPSTSASTLSVVSAGQNVTILDGRPTDGFYYVSYGGREGYQHGNYLRVVNASSGDDASPGDASGDTFRARGTGYYPDSSALEGGYVDRRGAKLRTLQQYLNGQADYVSVAMDTSAFAYGTRLRIKELEEKYNKVIEFRVVDTGGAFRGKGRSRIDICTANYRASIDSTINGMLTITVDE